MRMTAGEAMAAAYSATVQASLEVVRADSTIIGDELMGPRSSWSPSTEAVVGGIMSGAGVEMAYSAGPTVNRADVVAPQF